MRKVHYWGVAVVLVLLVGAIVWWGVSKLMERWELLNQFDAFVYDDGDDTLYWFEVSSRNGKVKGEFHRQKIKEKEENPLTGKITEKGYEFKVERREETLMLEVKPSGSDLLVRKRGEKNSTLYQGVDREELDVYIEANRDHSVEYLEDLERRKFFTELERVYGYLYSKEDVPYQLFLKIDEALLEGEVSGTLLVMTDTGDPHKPYEESRYEMNGITDGDMLEFYTTVEGKSKALKGHFHKNANGMDLPFWKTDEKDDKLHFYAVTEKEFKQQYEEFKARATY